MADSKFTIVNADVRVTLTLTESAVRRVYGSLERDHSISGLSEEYRLFSEIVEALENHK